MDHVLGPGSTSSIQEISQNKHDTFHKRNYALERARSLKNISISLLYLSCNDCKIGSVRLEQ